MPKESIKSFIDRRNAEKTASKSRWIQSAVKEPGTFTKQAKAAGKSVQAFASSVVANPDKHSTTTVKRAHLAQTFSKMAKGK